MIAGLLRGQRCEGGFGVHPYSKWMGAHWRLLSLVELGVPSSSPAARAAARTVLDWIAAPSKLVVVKGLERRHASMEGNALLVCCRLGMAKQSRVRQLVETLLRSQWPDGGWNCDVKAEGHRSSFHESLPPIRGLVEYHLTTGDREALAAAQRAGELLLEHRLFRSTRTGAVIQPEWLEIHWPNYWHYDFFSGLRAAASLGRLDDPRAADALELLRSRRRPDGTWRTSGHKYWRRRGAPDYQDAVDWGDAHQIVTPAALAMLQ
jgi:hypothetical protein